MPNFSLARIMYGTNEDFRATGWMNTSGISSPDLSSSANSSSASTGSSQLSLGAYLHKAWTALTARD